jgi:ribosomal protein S18 acetylase RimI-like enzyme
VSAEYEYYGRNSGLPSFIVYPGDVIVQLQDRITDEWIHALFRLNGTTNPTLRRIVPSMFKAIPKETIVASIEIDGRMVASGLGILDRGHVGLYAIYVDASCRRKGFAHSICSSILSEAHKKGMQNAYLQVVEGNTPAKHLYRTLGFEDLYTYWFRVK